MEAKIQNLTARVRALTCENAAMQAVSKAGGDVALLSPIIAKRLQAVEAENGDFEVQAFTEDNVRAVASGGRWAGPDDLVSEMRQSPTFQRFFVGQEGTDKGAGSNTGQNRSAMTHDQRGDYITKHGVDAYLGLPE